MSEVVKVSLLLGVEPSCRDGITERKKKGGMDGKVNKSTGLPYAKN